jgi:uncharacterized membrane protein
MKLRQLKTLIKEDCVNSRKPLNESMLDTVINYIIQKLVSKKTNKYFDTLAKDPEFVEAKKRVKDALQNIEQSAARYEKTREKYEKNKAEFIKKYGQKEADKIYRGDKYIYGLKYRG